MTVLTLDELQRKIARLVDKMSALKPDCAKHRALAAKRSALELQKAGYLATHTEALSKAAAVAAGGPVVASSVGAATTVGSAADARPRLPQALSFEEAEAQLERSLRWLWGLPQTAATTAARAKAEAALREARATQKAASPSLFGVTKMNKPRTSPLINDGEVTERVKEARERASEERRIAIARGLQKLHPAAFGQAQHHVATVARGKVVDEPAWVAFRASRLQVSGHPAFRGRQ